MDAPIAASADRSGARVNAVGLNLWAGLDVTTLVGVIDASVVAAYMAGVNVLLWHGMTLTIKLMICAVRWRRGRPLPRAAVLFIGAAALMICATLFSGAENFTPYIAAVGFLAHIILTLVLIGASPVRRYLSGAAVVIALSSAVHAAMSLTHHMASQWGRYSYFNGSEPNLGGEIAAAGALAAAFAFRRLYALPILVIELIDVTLLQARSASLTLIIAMVVIFVFDPQRRLSFRRMLFTFCGAAVVVSALMAFGFADQINASLSHIFLIDDQYRGIASGGSGRTELWNFAMSLFQSSPIVGHYLGYFDDIGFIGAHNFFAYGLSQFGISCLPFILSIGVAFWLLLLQDQYRFWVLSAALPLLLFNDRFININPYPFIVFVMLLAPTAPASQASSVARSPTTMAQTPNSAGAACQRN